MYLSNQLFSDIICIILDPGKLNKSGIKLGAFEIF